MICYSEKVYKKVLRECIFLLLILYFVHIILYLNIVYLIQSFKTMFWHNSISQGICTKNISIAFVYLNKKYILYFLQVRTFYLKCIEVAKIKELIRMNELEF